MTHTTPPSELGQTLELPSRDVLAYQLGATRALAERTAGWEQVEEPLSGEWADDPTWVTLARSLGVIPPADKWPTYDAEFDAYVQTCYHLAEEYTRGYEEAWQS